MLEGIGALVVQRLVTYALTRVWIYDAIVPTASVSIGQTSTAAGSWVEQLVLSAVPLCHHWAVALAGGWIKLIEAMAFLCCIWWAL